MATKTKASTKAKSAAKATTSRKVKKVSPLKALEKELTDMANAQFESAGYQRMFNAPFTKKGAQQFFLQHSLFNINRRDTWAYVQAKSPFDVKKLVWEHEEEELAGVPSRGGENHYELAIRQGIALGLKREDYLTVKPLDGTFTCCNAWINLMQSSHWLTAFAAAAALEFSNSNDVIKGGALSHRLGQKVTTELNIPLKKQHSNAEHVEADMEHALLLMKIAHLYNDKASHDMIRDGAEKSWMIDRIFRNFLGELLEQHA